MSDEINRTTYQQVQNQKWYPPTTAFLLGVLFILFVTLLGGAIEQSTDVINISGTLITALKMSSIGLGVGYYFGHSLKRKESGKSWFLFGAFSVLTAFSILSVDMLIFDQYPIYILLICGAILSAVAHITPFVAGNEQYMELLKYTSGYASTGIVTILAISDYAVTFGSYSLDWFESQNIIFQLIIAVVIFGVVWIAHAVVSENQKHDPNQR